MFSCVQEQNILTAATAAAAAAQQAAAAQNMHMQPHPQHPHYVMQQVTKHTQREM